jgi:hypothetical protein
VSKHLRIHMRSNPPTHPPTLLGDLFFQKKEICERIFHFQNTVSPIGDFFPPKKKRKKKMINVANNSKFFFPQKNLKFLKSNFYVLTMALLWMLYFGHWITIWKLIFKLPYLHIVLFFFSFFFPRNKAQRHWNIDNGCNDNLKFSPPNSMV